MESLETQFPVLITSNACMDIYPHNRPQQFKVQLPERYDLPGIWGIGLRAIQYPHNWNTIRKAFQITIKNDTPETEPLLLEKIIVPAGPYEEVKSLCSIINDEIQAAYLDAKSKNKIIASTAESIGSTPPAELEFLEIEHRVKLSSAKLPNVQLIIEDPNESGYDARNLLGIYPQTKLAVGEKGSKDASLTMHFPSLFVYTSTIQYMGVNNLRTPILEWIPVEGRQKEYIYKEFQRPTYHRLARSQLSEIDILIADDRGEEVPFLSGKVTLKLDFKRFG